MRKFVGLAVAIAALVIPVTASAHRYNPQSAQSIAVNWAWTHDCPSVSFWSCAAGAGGQVGVVSTLPSGAHSWVIKTIVVQRHVVPPFSYRHWCRDILVTHFAVAAVSHKFTC